MATVSSNMNLSALTYTRAESIDILTGVTLTVDSTPTIRPGTITGTAAGAKLRIVNTSTTTPLLFELDDENHDFIFRNGGVLEVRGQPMALGTGNGAQQTWDFKTLFGGVIKHMTYVEVEETAGSGVYVPWPIIDEDPVYCLSTATTVLVGGADPTAFTAGNTKAGQVLFWHQGNRTLRCGDGTNGAVIPNGCAVRIPNIYIGNRFNTNSSRTVTIITSGATPTAGTFTIVLKSEDGSTVLGTTGALAWNASSSTILTALTTILGAGTATVTGSSLTSPGYTITWSGSLTTGFGNIPQIGIATSSLTPSNAFATVRASATAANNSLVDLAPLGILDTEWASFSHKILFSNSGGPRSCRNVSTGWGSANWSFVNSVGDCFIDGFHHTNSPYEGYVASSISTIFGNVTIRRTAQATKNPSLKMQILNTPNVLEFDRNTMMFYSSRAATVPTILALTALPANLALSRTTIIGSRLTLNNMSGPNLVGFAYADGVRNVQDTQTTVWYPITLSSCPNLLLASVESAGPMAARYSFVSQDAASSGLSVLSTTIDMGNNQGGIASLFAGNNTISNITLSNVRSNWLIDTSGTKVAGITRVKKLLASYATTNNNLAIDFGPNFQYDLVGCYIKGLRQPQAAGLTNFVGGNYADSSTTPTTGHVTFGPFGLGDGVTTTNGAYVSSDGGVFLPTAGATLEATIPFPMHAITSFQNVTPIVAARVLGERANRHYIKAHASITGGTFTLTVQDAAGVTLGTTAAIAQNATNTAVATAVAAIPGIGATSNLTVVGSSIAQGYTIQFVGTLTDQLFFMSINGASLTGGTQPGVAYALADQLLRDGTETTGANYSYEFAVRPYGGSWSTYQAMTGTNLSTAIAGLTGYSAGGGGLEVKIKVVALTTNEYQTIRQVSLRTNIDPSVWFVGDSSITLRGPAATDVTKVFRASDNTQLYSFTGGGVKEFQLGLNYNTAVYFRREDSTGRILMTTYPATKVLSFSDNGSVDLFYGTEVQLAQVSEVSQINTKVDSLTSSANSISSDLSDVKGTGFAKDTHSLTNIKSKASLAAALSA